MSLELVVFAIASGLAIVSALAMVVVKTPVRSVISLLLTFFALAVLSILLAAPFIAALQVIVYAGAILVLFLFVIMLLNLRREDLGHPKVTAWKVVGVAAAAMIAVKLAIAVAQATADAAPVDLATGALQGYGQTRGVSGELLVQYFYPFEVTSVLLLVAIIGALVVARKRQGGAA